VVEGLRCCRSSRRPGLPAHGGLQGEGQRRHGPELGDGARDAKVFGDGRHDFLAWNLAQDLARRVHDAGGDAEHDALFLHRPRARAGALRQLSQLARWAGEPLGGQPRANAICSLQHEESRHKSTLTWLSSAQPSSVSPARAPVRPTVRSTWPAAVRFIFFFFGSSSGCSPALALVGALPPLLAFCCRAPLPHTHMRAHTRTHAHTEVRGEMLPRCSGPPTHPPYPAEPSQLLPLA